MGNEAMNHNPFCALLDDQDGLPEFHTLLDAVIDAADTILSALVTWVTDSMAAAEIRTREAAAGVVWGVPCAAPVG